MFVGLDYLLENFFTALSAVFVAFVRRVAVYLLCTVESSGLLYTAGGNTKSFYYFIYFNKKSVIPIIMNPFSSSVSPIGLLTTSTFCT